MNDDFSQKLSRQIAELQTELADRADGLRNVIAELREEVAVHFRAGERLERARSELDQGAAADHERTLTEQIAAIQQDIQRLDARVAALEDKR